MSWDVVLFGSFQVPELSREAWLTSPITGDELPWLDDVGGVETRHDAPEGLLAYLAEVALAPHHFFDVAAMSSLVTVQGYLGEEAYRDVCQALALLFASSAGFGGTGELHVVGYQGIRFGERLTLAGGRADFRQLGPSELAEVERSRAFECVDARVHQRFDALVGRTGAPGRGRRASWVIHPFTGRRVRAALADAP